jgi:hypothetical protein
MYRCNTGGSVLLVGVYVDNLIITGASPAAVEAFKGKMKRTFQMCDIVLLSFYLGIEAVGAAPTASSKKKKNWALRCDDGRRAPSL